MTDLVRICPSCGTHHPPEHLRCDCGALLFGVDLSRPLLLAEDEAPQAPAPAPAAAEAGTIQHCPHPDCGQANPADATRCLYCNRPLAPSAAETEATTPGLLQLPAALRARYRVTQPLAARGMEADILLVAPLAATDAQPGTRVAKVYRQGILPSADVQQRIARVDAAHCVQLFETSISDGRAYEVMEYCALGSLRERMPAEQALPLPLITAVARELAAALQAVHAVALVHRDLKPENILLRSAEPLDLVLTDFGSASVVQATQRFTSVARTLLYAAPEALSGVIDAKADYWALGMLLLEMATGQHPFQGLSDAVVLHHLTTRSVDTRAVADANLRKLLRGLLLRDPKRRWGGAEIARWLAGDPSLPSAADTGAEGEFKRPYAVRDERCHSAEQLAVALARHWDAGVADIRNGQLLTWFTEVQKDQNAVRLLLRTRYDQQLSADQQLLRLILHFAPGIPPVWRGRSIALRALLVQANQALQGDDGAGQWLLELYESRVLDTYVAAGNTQITELAQRWQAAADDFDGAWAEGAALLHAQGAQQPALGAAVNYDHLVYGHASGLTRPPAARLHPRLLAAAYDPAWVERLRRQLQHELSALTVQRPGLAALGDARAMSAAELLACETLLPDLRKRLDEQAERDARQQQQQAEEVAALIRQLQDCQADISRRARHLSYLFPGVAVLRQSLDAHADLVAHVRSLGASDQAWLAARKQALRSATIARRMRQLCDRLSERSTANAGWLGERALGAAVAALLLATWFWGPRGFQLALVALAVIVAWRVLPLFGAVRALRQLARRLQQRSGR